MIMNNGYGRVAKDAQDPTNHAARLKAARIATVFHENMRGTRADRLRPRNRMAKLNAGDMVISSAVDGLSSDTANFLVIAYDIRLRRAGAYVDLRCRKVRRPTDHRMHPQCRTNANGVVFGRKPGLTQRQMREAHAGRNGRDIPQLWPRIQGQPDDDRNIDDMIAPRRDAKARTPSRKNET